MLAPMLAAQQKMDLGVLSQPTLDTSCSPVTALCIFLSQALASLDCRGFQRFQNSEYVSTMNHYLRTSTLTEFKCQAFNPNTRPPHTPMLLALHMKGRLPTVCVWKLCDHTACCPHSNTFHCLGDSDLMMSPMS